MFGIDPYMMVVLILILVYESRLMDIRKGA